MKIHATGADTEDWENVKPCNVIIECHGVVKMEEIDPEEFKVQPLYELQTIQVDNLYKLLLNGCGGTITCRKIAARVEEEEIDEEKSDQKKRKIKKAKKNQKTESNKLDNVSMVGRLAYLIMCCEAYLKSMFPDRDWSFVAKNMWDVTSSRYWENWSDKYVGFIPSVLFDYKKYDKEDLGECYTEEDFESLKSLYSGLTEGKEDDPDDEFADIITKPFDFVMAYEGTCIGDGSEGFNLIEETENILAAHNIPLPDYHRVEFSTFKQFHGWGNEFDGTKLSIILNE